jgi:alcohol dehydrogenase, propanol-preferring
MIAMVLHQGSRELDEEELPAPEPSSGEVLIRVHACGVCRTDLHILDGELPEPNLPLVPGHEIVGTVTRLGAGVQRPGVGSRIGVPWLGWSCGECEFCTSGRENLCPRARFTGYHRNGGFAEYVVADHRFCFSIPDSYPDLQAAPLLCAGLIGYRAYRMLGAGTRIGIYGFGAAAHVLTQVAVARGRQVYAFTRPGDERSQRFARELGAAWAGHSAEPPPVPLDGAIIFAPAGELVPRALQAVAAGGAVVCGGIHMSPIPSFPYELLWNERVLRSVANLTRADAEEFLALAPTVPVRTRVEAFPLRRANEALSRLRDGTITGAAVLRVADDTTD